jgi:TrmH family RNA methyltransferase
MGACVRVAAAANAAGVFTTGHNDPWHPDAIRGSAGLHFAIPVARVTDLPPSDRPLVAVDPEGQPLEAQRIPERAVLAFGTERYGLSPGLRENADVAISIPMKPGVSSLNLATSVAVVLYAWRLGTSLGS